MLSTYRKQKIELALKEKVIEKVFFCLFTPKMRIKNIRSDLPGGGQHIVYQQQPSLMKRQCQRERERWMKPRKQNNQTERKNKAETIRKQAFRNWFAESMHSGVKNSEKTRKAEKIKKQNLR